MKIVINAASAKMGGGLTYLRGLLQHLPPPESGHEYLVFLPPQTAAALKNLPPNVRLFPTTIGNAGVGRRLWWDQLKLRSLLKKTGADVLFSSANFGLFFCPIKQVLLIQNLLYFSDTYQRMFVSRHSLKEKINFKLRRWLLCRSAQAADVVMTPSKTMLEALRAYADLPASKALVNHWGVSVLHAPPSHPRLSDWSVERAIVLAFPSLYAEHKDLGTLLRALPILNSGDGRRFILRTTANPDDGPDPRTALRKQDLELSRQPEIARQVEFLNRRDWQQAQELYQNADIFVSPSLVESFGYPLVEAMAHGLPVVAADTEVNREICGEAALYFRPRRPEDLARAVREVAADGLLRQRLIATGKERVDTRFRWSEHVARLLETVSARNGNDA